MAKYLLISANMLAYVVTVLYISILCLGLYENDRVERNSLHNSSKRNDLAALNFGKQQTSSKRNG